MVVVIGRGERINGEICLPSWKMLFVKITSESVTQLF